MQEIVPLLAALAFFAAMAVLILLFLRWQARQANAWTVVAEGVFDRAEHRRGSFSSWSGMPMTPILTSGVHAMTIVHLRDGRTFAIDGSLSPPPPGTSVRLRRNGLGEHVLERLA